ncbi:MAG TPA: HDOD domain-containing protein [Deltaproteobacteria bacterium]|nr:HDOD domain-containing protein [Deltaproteobacteria bacterium]HPR54930.1 HDOD domain-containing protein [Deltaproteobacteria bacterium]HXK47763.1 HDOD domain-containing protein [Deltaproteobacteria bacterium]
MRVLVVDDDLVSREKMKRIMNGIGECDEAASGQTALDAILKAKEEGSMYDLITLDISMPEMDGTEVLNRIREMEKGNGLARDDQVKIIMVTATSDKNTIITCIRSGCNDYITKPFSSDTLTKKLRDNGLVSGGFSQAQGRSNGQGDNGKNPLIPVIARFNRGEIELPPLPRIQQKYHELMKAGANLQQIGDLLKQDPAISSKLIRISNSSYYRGITENTTVEQAINRLGLVTTKQTVDALSGRELYDGAHQKYAEVVERLWEHSLSCAHACQIIVELKAFKLGEDPFTLGLLHDIGKLMLLRVIGELEKNGKSETESDVQDLLSTVDTHHGKSGSVLLKKWLFPGIFVQIAELHDQVENILTPSRELLVVHLANVIVKSMGYGTPNPPGTEPESLGAVASLGIEPSMISVIKEQVKTRMEELKDYLR